MIAPAIHLLNTNGFRTVFCCSSHPTLKVIKDYYDSNEEMDDFCEISCPPQLFEFYVMFDRAYPEVIQAIDTQNNLRESLFRISIDTFIENFPYSRIFFKYEDFDVMDEDMNIVPQEYGSWLRVHVYIPNTDDQNFIKAWNHKCLTGGIETEMDLIAFINRDFYSLCKDIVKLKKQNEG